jgi:hopene-associated glycosyltransferase HpnB
MGVLAALSALGWLHLCWVRSSFWRSDQRLPTEMPQLRVWPSVAAVVPARNEAGSIGLAVRSLLAQDYRGPFRIVVVDDGSTDGTGSEAEEASGGDDRLLVARGEALPKGWTGKLWAVQQGVRLATERWPETQYFLLTDADIRHHPTNLRRLVVKAESERRKLVSLMVRLHCRSFCERLLVPAFIFFFQKLHPFPRVNDPGRPEAAAAGGCMLVDRRTLEQAGGIATIRDRLIDDCALAQRIKAHGSIWLGLATQTHSLRSYPRLRDFWAMVARTAFTYLEHSHRRLAITVIAMSTLYLVPPTAVLWGFWASDAVATGLGALACMIMAGTFQPTLALHRMPLAWALALPVAALLYLAMTVDSAWRHRQGRGGLWKGRTFERGLRADVHPDERGTAQP